MLDISPNAGAARQSDAEIRRLEDLNILRELEGTIDVQDAPCARPDLVHRLTQGVGKLRLSLGSYGYP